MNSYFLTLVLNPDQDEKARKELLDSVANKLKMSTARAGALENGKLEIDLWGSRNLAYPIKKQVSGYYAHFEFETDPAVAKDLDKTLRVEEDIIRYLLVRDEGRIRKVEQQKEKTVLKRKIVRKSTDGK